MIWPQGDLALAKAADEAVAKRLELLAQQGGNPEDYSQEAPSAPTRPAARPAAAQRPAPAPAPTQKSSTGFDDMDDDIPF